MGRDVKVSICTPSGETWDRKYGISLVNLVVYSFGRCPRGLSSLELSISNSVGSILPQSRTRLVQDALARKATHVLFIDSDQTFPPDTLHRLLSWEVPVVACNVATKRFPSIPTARRKSDVIASGEVVYTREGQSGLEKVWRVGAGVMLVESWVFGLMKQPWFPIRWSDERNDFDGEDWCFVEQLEEKGLSVRIDQGLSWEIGHRGVMEYTHELCLAGELHEEVFGIGDKGRKICETGL